ncbi:MAG: hypothetical protein IPG50_11560 [Myxococcales bacterium]|nr:hypothetical protein [Myxococcales bacterium]
MMVVDHDCSSYVHRLRRRVVRITAAARRALAAPPAGMRVSALAPESYRAAAVSASRFAAGPSLRRWCASTRAFVFEAPKAWARRWRPRDALLQAMERARGHAASLPAVTGKAPASSCTHVVSWRTDAGAFDFVLELAAPPHEGDAAPERCRQGGRRRDDAALDLATLLGASFAEASEATDAA